MTRLATSKPLALGVIAALSGATLLAWSRTWFTVDLQPGISLTQTIAVGGDQAAPALVPLSLASLALVAALAIASPIVRVVLASILALLGAGVATLGATVLADPVERASQSVIASTGLDGRRAVDDAIVSIEVTAWPVVTIVLGALLGIVAIVLAFTTRQWATASARYDARAQASDDSAPAASAVSDWDSLSGGDDPTTPSGSR